MRALLVLATAAGLTGLTACYLDLGDFSGRYRRDFHENYPLEAGGRLTVETFNGPVEISGWDQAAVDISGTAQGPTQQEADNLKIDIDHSPGAVSIRVMPPSGLRHGLGARFTIKVPRTAVVERVATSNGGIRILEAAGPARLRTSNGAIRVERLRGAVDAQTSNGTIELIDVAGDATARTSNGRIHAERLAGGLDATTSNGGVSADLEGGSRPIRVETSNGSVDLALPASYASDVRVGTSNGGITLHLPGGINARVAARTSNSSITTDFPVRSEGETARNRLEGTLGNGGPLIELSTSNGGIRLVKM